MKSTILAISLAFSVALMAKTPATNAFENLRLESGTYEGHNNAGQKCSVKLNMKTDSVTVTLTAKTVEVFTVLNSSLNYKVNEETLEISATQSLNYPNYVRGGTKILNVRPTEDDVQFFVSNILMDHRGNDMSTFSDCRISL